MTVSADLDLVDRMFEVDVVSVPLLPGFPAVTLRRRQVVVADPCSTRSHPPLR